MTCGGPMHKNFTLQDIVANKVHDTLDNSNNALLIGVLFLIIVALVFIIISLFLLGWILLR